MIGAARYFVKDFGADVNQADEEGSMPLSIAVYLGDLEIM
jgi:ankyrin repeat protein